MDSRAEEAEIARLKAIPRNTLHAALELRSARSHRFCSALR